MKLNRKISVSGEGDIFLRCVSEHSIFVQSHYLDWAAGKAPGEVVHKMHKGAEFKVCFEFRDDSFLCRFDSFSTNINFK